MTFTGTITKVESNGTLVTVSFNLLDAKGNGSPSNLIFPMDVYNQLNGYFRPGQTFTDDLAITAGGKTLVATFSFK